MGFLAHSCALLMLLAPPPPAPADTLAPVLKKLAEAYGGEEAIARAGKLSELGSVTSPTRGEGTVVRIYERPDRLRVEISFASGSKEQRILDGKKGFRDGQPVEGPPLQAMELQAARLDLPWLLLQNRSKLRDLGEIERGGKTRRGLELPLGEGLTVTAELDPATGRIARSAGAMAAGPMGKMEFVTEYADYESIAGLLVARRENNFAGGQATGEIAVKRVEVPKTLPKDAFKP